MCLIRQATSTKQRTFQMHKSLLSVHVRSASLSTILVRNMLCYHHPCPTRPNHAHSALMSPAQMAGPSAWDAILCKRIISIASRMRLARRLRRPLLIPTTRLRLLVLLVPTIQYASEWIVTGIESTNLITIIMILRKSCLVQDRTNILKQSVLQWCHLHLGPLSRLHSLKPKTDSDRPPYPKFNHHPTSTHRRQISCSTSNLITPELQWPSLVWTKLTSWTIDGARRPPWRPQVLVPMVVFQTSQMMSNERHAYYLPWLE